MLALPKNLTFDGSDAEFFAPSDWLHLDEVVRVPLSCNPILSSGDVDGVICALPNGVVRVPCETRCLVWPANVLQTDVGCLLRVSPSRGLPDWQQLTSYSPETCSLPQQRPAM